MRLLMLNRYGPLGASSRMRALQYLPAMEAAGFSVAVRPLFDDGYVRDLYSGRRHPLRVLMAYVRRIADLLASARFDAVWTEKELLPWVPAMLELGLLPKRARLVVDIDDAVFHRYDAHRAGLVRHLLGRKIDAVLARADLVLAGNDYLANRARAAGSRQIEWLPTVVDLRRYPDPPPKPARNGPVRVGWIGSPSTAGYLAALSSALLPLRAEGLIECIAIGANPEQVRGGPFTAVPWHEDTEVEHLQTLDIGIMPLPEAPWEHGKCGYKLIQYMASSVPVVASPVGVNTSIVKHGRNGYLADSPSGWVAALRELIASPDLRARMGVAGREQVRSTYNLQVQSSRLIAMLEGVVEARGHC